MGAVSQKYSNFTFHTTIRMGRDSGEDIHMASVVFMIPDNRLYTSPPQKKKLQTQGLVRETHTPILLWHVGGGGNNSRPKRQSVFCTTREDLPQSWA